MHISASVQESEDTVKLSPGVSDDVIKEVMAAEAARKASGDMASSSSMEKQISEQMVLLYLLQPCTDIA